MKNTFLMSLFLVTACGSNSINDAGGYNSKNVQTTTIETDHPESLQVVSSTETPITFTVEEDGQVKGFVHSPSFHLTVPATTTITVSPFLNASAGSTLQTENFGYFNALVKNNSSAVWAKTDIFLSVRFATVASQFQDASNDILVTSIDKPVNGAEAETVTTIPQCTTAGCGTRAYSFCNATVGACAAKQVINTNANNLSILGNFSVPAGTYNGTLTWELVTTP